MACGDRLTQCIGAGLGFDLSLADFSAATLASFKVDWPRKIEAAKGLVLAYVSTQIAVNVPDCMQRSDDASRGDRESGPTPVGKVSTFQRMETSRMKPYTTIDRLPDGIIYLPMQLAGISRGEISSIVNGRRLLNCSIPPGQTEQQAWCVLLDFDESISIELASSSTGVRSWDEFGTINIRSVDRQSDCTSCHWIDLELPDGLVTDRIDVICWSGQGLIVDAGIEVRLTNGQSLSIVAIDIPGALSIAMPGAPVRGDWQFPQSEYSTLNLQGR